MLDKGVSVRKHFHHNLHAIQISEHYGSELEPAVANKAFCLVKSCQEQNSLYMHIKWKVQSNRRALAKMYGNWYGASQQVLSRIFSSSELTRWKTFRIRISE